jgi:hypothetical protein
MSVVFFYLVLFMTRKVVLYVTKEIISVEKIIFIEKIVFVKDMTVFVIAADFVNNDSVNNDFVNIDFVVV